MSTRTEPSNSESIKRFYWLDDDPGRVSTDLVYQVENPEIEGLTPVKLEVIGLKQVDIPMEVASMIQSRPKADLVIIDHVLNGARQSSIMKEGSSIAAAIRGVWPEVPIVGVSAIFNTKREKLSRVFEQEYIELFDFSDLTHDIPSLHAICDGFRRLCEKFKHFEPTEESPLKTVLATLLNCPLEDRENLTTILPAEFKEKADFGTAHLLARWVWHHLTERPGLLYDARYAAVLLGVNVKGFEKVALQFEEAKYTGVFASAARPRWWKSLIKSRLFELVPHPKFASMLQRGRLLSNITEENFSRAYFSDDPEPDTLAAGDEIDPDIHPERLRNTVVHPAETLVVGFEPRRIFKSA